MTFRTLHILKTQPKTHKYIEKFFSCSPEVIEPKRHDRKRIMEMSECYGKGHGTNVRAQRDGYVGGSTSQSCLGFSEGCHIV